jgi:hypothetical protein
LRTRFATASTVREGWLANKWPDRRRGTVGIDRRQRPVKRAGAAGSAKARRPSCHVGGGEERLQVGQEAGSGGGLVGRRQREARAEASVA